MHLMTKVYDKKDSYVDFLPPTPSFDQEINIKLRHHFRKLEDFTKSMKKTSSIDGNKG